MLGQDGLTQATKVAILNANYIAKRLENYFPILYKGDSGLIAHECILDFRKFKASVFFNFIFLLKKTQKSHLIQFLYFGLAFYVYISSLVLIKIIFETLF